MNRDLDSEAYYEKSLLILPPCQYDKSIIICKRALKAKSSHYDAHFQWGLNLIDKEDSDRSVRKHKEILLLKPRNCKAHYNLGVTFEQQNKWFEAEIEYKKALEIDPSSQESAHNLAIMLTKQAKYTEALAQYEKNLNDYLYISSTYNSYGYLKLLLGRYEDAIGSFGRALERNSQNNLALFNKSMAFYCLEKSELAIETFKESLNFEDCQSKFKTSLLIYQGELRRFENLLLENADLGEIDREKVEIIIKALHFIIDLLNKHKNLSLKEN